MDSLPNMQSRPTLATLSAKGAGKPIFMHSNPQDLYQSLFGSISTGEVRERYEARSNVLQSVENIAIHNSTGLPRNEKLRYSSYVDGFREMNGLQTCLCVKSSKNFAPDYGEKFTNPEFETDWHDSLLDLGISALKSGITNTLTIGSGRGEILELGGLGIDQQGHNLGHMKQPDNQSGLKFVNTIVVCW